MNLTARLLEWLLGPLLFVWLVAIGTTFMVATETADSATDQQLETVVRVLTAEWQQYGERAPTEVPSKWTRQWLLDAPEGRVFFAVFDDRWNRLAGESEFVRIMNDYHLVFMQQQPTSNEYLAEGMDLAIGESRYRVRNIVLSRTPLDTQSASRTYLVVAQNKEFESRLIRKILAAEVVPQSAILLFALALVWYGTTYLSRPMTRLREQLVQRGPDNLSAIETQSIPRELEPLMDGINSLIARLQNSMDAQRRFISDAAHQLRTPLAALRAQGELLTTLPQGPERERALARLLNTNLRISRLANQLLSLARAESAGTTAEHATFEVGALCAGVVIDLADSAIERDIDFSFERDANRFELSGDETLFGEMIRNLLDNAFKYTPKGGAVIISTSANTRQITVEDSGPGIAASDREIVFAPFSRRAVIDPNTHQPIAGTGLGLTIVREVANLHGGVVSIDASPLGGARVQIRFQDAARKLGAASGAAIQPI